MKVLANKEMYDFWSEEGGRKWLRFQNILAKGLDTFGKEAMIAASISSSERVLDIGCGCGDTTFEIAQMVGSNGHVHGVDISNLILKKAQIQDRQSRKENSFHHNLSFECADVQTHNFVSMVYDVAFSRFGVMFFKDPVAAFANIRQALYINGRIAFICWQPIAENQWVRLPLEVASNHGLLPYSYDDDEPDAFSFGDPNRVERILDMAGFVDISIEGLETKFNIGADLDEAVTFLTHMGPASGVIEPLELCSSTRYQIINDLFKQLVSYKENDGVYLGAAMWIVTAKKK